MWIGSSGPGCRHALPLRAQPSFRSSIYGVGGDWMRTFRRAAKTGVVVGAALALLMVYPGTSFGNSSPSLDSAMQQARQRADAINNVNDVPKVVQNLIPGTLQARDLAIKK